ncbi:MAG TPA: hypothetical protein VHZ55_14725, partial [Bryobacteraceae bacterium]|nr:hypothetical protein [Bryobacteraceae bacterium]
ISIVEARPHTPIHLVQRCDIQTLVFFSRFVVLAIRETDYLIIVSGRRANRKLTEFDPPAVPMNGLPTIQAQLGK